MPKRDKIIKKREKKKITKKYTKQHKHKCALPWIFLGTKEVRLRSDMAIDHGDSDGWFECQLNFSCPLAAIHINVFMFFSSTPWQPQGIKV